MKDFLELIKKYGATAVLVAWLFHTNYRVATLEHKLYKCLEEDKIQEQIHYLNNEVSKLKHQAKKKYYSKPKKQVIQG